ENPIPDLKVELSRALIAPCSWYGCSFEGTSEELVCGLTMKIGVSLYFDLKEELGKFQVAFVMAELLACGWGFDG
ncbi:hypothetical protein Droror1_Dr00012336, partial [Drosera rotundifolia]